MPIQTLDADDLMLLTFRDVRTFWGILAPAALKFEAVVNQAPIKRSMPQDSIRSLIGAGRDVCTQCAEDLIAYYRRISPELIAAEQSDLADLRAALADRLRRRLTADYGAQSIRSRYSNRNHDTLHLQTGDAGWNMAVALDVYGGIAISDAKHKDGLYVAWQNDVDPAKKTVLLRGDDPLLLMRACLEHLQQQGRLADVLGQHAVKKIEALKLELRLSEKDLFLVDLNYADVPGIRVTMDLTRRDSRSKDMMFDEMVDKLNAECERLGMLPASAPPVVAPGA